jgi:hypothetical protein
MKLNNLVAKPQLVKCELNDEETIAEFGEPLEWYIYDRQPLEKFMKMATTDTNNSEQLIATMRDMILDEAGQPLLVDGATLPSRVMLRVLNKVSELLGK